MSAHARVFLGVILLCGALTRCWALQNEAILPIPTPPELDAKATLGQELYNAKLFSDERIFSCASCHSIQKGGADQLPKYIGRNGKQGLVKTPTILNASLNSRLFWDGRAKNLYEVIDDHLKDQTIFANNWESVVQRLKDNKSLNEQFKRVYSDKITPHNIKDALNSYFKTLLTPQSPFDRYLNGDQKAISEDAKKGYKLFKLYGCITCHEGSNLGGNLFQRMGIYKDYFADRGNLTEADLGRFNVTGKEEDKYVFKVPTLRNIALNSPYFHDGSAQTLEQAIQMMGIYEVGQQIPDYEVPYIVKFLETLTGRIPKERSNSNH